MREGANEPRQHRRDRVLRRSSALDLARDEMADDFGIGLALELAAFGDQLVAERLEILDDAVVDQRDRPDDVRVGIADRRRAVRRPARVRDAGAAVERVLVELAREIVELALGPPAVELAMLDRADAGRVIAAIFEPLEPVEQPLRDVRCSDNPDNSAHPPTDSFNRRSQQGLAIRAMGSHVLLEHRRSAAVRWC